MSQSRIYNPFVTGGGGGGGESNTGSNVGTGSGVFRDKTGVTLNFKSIKAGSNITITPSANEVEIASTSGSGTSTTTETRTISAGEAAAKALTLGATPLVAGNVRVWAIQGPAQENGVDFSVVGTTLSWAGLALDGVLDAGDKLLIQYEI